MIWIMQAIFNKLLNKKDPDIALGFLGYSQTHISQLKIKGKEINKHILMTGQYGTGKSLIMQSLIMQSLIAQMANGGNLSFSIEDPPEFTFESPTKRQSVSSIFRMGSGYEFFKAAQVELGTTNSDMEYESISLKIQFVGQTASEKVFLVSSGEDEVFHCTSDYIVSVGKKSSVQQELEKTLADCSEQTPIVHFHHLCPSGFFKFFYNETPCRNADVKALIHTHLLKKKHCIPTTYQKRRKTL